MSGNNNLKKDKEYYVTLKCTVHAFVKVEAEDITSAELKALSICYGSEKNNEPIVFMWPRPDEDNWKVTDVIAAPLSINNGVVGTKKNLKKLSKILDTSLLPKK